MKTSLRLAVVASMLLAALALPASASRGGGGHGGGGHGGGGHSGGSHSGGHSGASHGSHGSGHGHHGSWHHHRGGAFVVGAFAGVPYWWWWNQAYPYEVPIWLPEPVDSLPVPAGVDAGEGFWWYYCADSQAYYPYVQECPSEWQRVLPQPPAN